MSGHWSGGSWTVESETTRTTTSQAQTNTGSYTGSYGASCYSGIYIETREVSRGPLSPQSRGMDLINNHHLIISDQKTNLTQPTGIDWNNLVENVFQEEISNFARELNSTQENKK